MLKKYAQETNQFQPAAPVTGMIASRRNVGATRRAIKAALAATLAGFFANAGAIAAPTAALDVAPVKSETELQNAFDALIAESKAAMMSDPALAVERATKAEAFVRALNDGVDADVQLATALWLKGEAQYRAGQSPVAMAAIDEALALVADADSLLYADLVLAQGRIASRNADVETAVKSYFEAHKRFAALKEARKESMTMQAIGSIYRDAESFGKAIEYYERAMETYPGDPRVDLSSFNNRGNIYKDMGQSNEARAYFEKALAIAEDMGSAHPHQFRGA